MMKTFKLILSALFAVFAVVQLNDPDPWAWVGLYLYVAALCGFSAFGKSNLYTLMAGLGIILVWMISLVPDFINWINIGMPTITGSMKAESPHVELTREFLGLLIAGGAIGWLFISHRKQ